MSDETQRLLGSLDAGLLALRNEHNRHADDASQNFAALRADIVTLRVELAEIKVESGHGGGFVRHLVTALIAAIAGLAGGHAPLPGAH